MITSINWQAFSQQLVTTFAHFLWQGAVIGAALAVLLRLCSSGSSNTRYVIASVAFALLPLCVIGTFASVHHAGDSIFVLQVSVKPDAPTIVSPLPDAEPTSGGELPSVEIASSPIRPSSTANPPVEIPTVAAAADAPESAWWSTLSTASPYLIMAYFVGVGLSMMRLGSSVWTSGRVRRAVQKIEDAAVIRIISEQTQRLGLSRIPSFGLCNRISVPVVVGILKPTILLPPAILSGLAPEQLAAILSHEMAHIRRYDLLVNLLQRVVESLLFFHPVTWWISRQMSDQREDCCDDLAAAGCGRLQFAGALLQMAELCAKDRGLTIGPQLEAMAADGGKQSQLTRRVHRLLGEQSSPRFVLSRASMITATVATLMLTATVLAFAQTDANQTDDSSELSAGAPSYDQTKFARPPARYTHLVYDQSVPDPTRGATWARVVQPLPAPGTAVQKATPYTEQSLTAESADRIRSSYPTFRPGESIVVKDNSVLLRSASAGSDKVLVSGIFGANNFARILARAAVSPDKTRLAAAVFVGDDDKPVGSRPLFDVHVFDISGAEPSSNVIRRRVAGDAIMGGSYLPAAVAPPIFWSDDDNLLLVTPKPSKGEVQWVYLDSDGKLTATELEEMEEVFFVRDGEVLKPTHDLVRIDIRERSSKKVCDLKLHNLERVQQTSTDFWRRSDGAIMLRSHGTDSRIDLANSKATADRHLSPHYELRGDRFKPSLWYGDEQLAEVIYFHNVGVSPDGRSVAWYARTNPQDTSNLGNTSQHPTTLWFHSPEIGAVKLADGHFAWDNYWNVFDNPVLNPRFHWLTQSEFSAQADASDDVANQSANADYSKQPIAWGQPKNGLRVGLMFAGQPENAVKQFQHGDLAQAHLFVQNVDSQPVKCQLLLPHPLDGWGVNIEKSDGASVLVERIFVSSFSPLRLFEAELAPEEIQPITGKLPKFREGNEDEGYVPELKHLEFQIEARTPEQGQHTLPFTYGLSNGTHTASSFVTFRRADMPGTDISLSTGKHAFQVGGKATNEAKVRGIKWGEAASGLRMGVCPAASAKGTIRFRQGDWIRYEVWLNNESVETIVIPRDPRDYFGPNVQDGNVNLIGGSNWASFALPLEALEKAKLVLAPGESARFCTTQAQFVGIDAKRPKYGPTPLRLKPGWHPIFAEFGVSFSFANDAQNGEHVRLRSASSEIEVLPAARLQVQRLVQWTIDLKESQQRTKVLDAEGAAESLVADLAEESLFDEDDVLTVRTVADEKSSSMYSVMLKLRQSCMERLQRAVDSLLRTTERPVSFAVFADGKWLASRQLADSKLDSHVVIASSLTIEQAEKIEELIRKILPKPAADDNRGSDEASMSGNAGKTPEKSSLVAALPQTPRLPDSQPDAGDEPTAAQEPTRVEDAEKVSPLSHYEGTVLGPDGKPMSGAEVFVISTWNETTRLGPVRDVTNSSGKFSFNAPDMTWKSLGNTMRRGGLLVAKKDGFTAEWIETWGHSRGIFSTGLWGQTSKQTLELQLTQDDVPIRGQLLDSDGNPVAGARVRLSRIMIPRNRDLTEFINHWSKAHVSETFMTGINYKREINKHFELMDVKADWVADADGRFELPGIGRDRMVQLEITSPEVLTTRIQVMSRDTEDVGIMLDGFGGEGKPTQMIYGANFSAKLTPGLTVTGVVRDRETKQPVAGMWVTHRGYNPLTAPAQATDAVVTDVNGRFTLRGLNPKLLEYEKESTRSITAIPQPGVQYLRAGTFFEKDKDTVIETVRGIGYRLMVVDEDGKTVNAKVEYQRINPNSIGADMIKSVGGGKSGHLNHAARRDDGTYEGFVLPGPGAVLVSVPGNEYRPAHVDPKSFFAPGKTWDVDSTYTFGTHNILALGGSWFDQREREAIVLVNPSVDSKTLTLTAMLIRDQPRAISLVDTDGKPVFGAVARMHERRGTSHVNQTIVGSTFPMEGLNVDKDQWITFLHEQRKLATVVSIRGDSDAGVTVPLQPWATVTGRFVDEEGNPVPITSKSEFSTIVRNAAHGAKEYFAHTVNQDGTFQIDGFAPGQNYTTSGTYRKRKNYIPGGMFKNLVLSPGETRDLGDIQVQVP